MKEKENKYFIMHDDLMQCCRRPISMQLVHATENPIEKYVGWTDMSSYFIFNISGVTLKYDLN